MTDETQIEQGSAADEAAAAAAAAVAEASGGPADPDPSAPDDPAPDAPVKARAKKGAAPVLSDPVAIPGNLPAPEDRPVPTGTAAGKFDPNEPTVTMIFPNSVKLLLPGGRTLEWPEGPGEVPQTLVDYAGTGEPHWWLTSHGVTTYDAKGKSKSKG